jgi:hypothetical protein
MTPRDFERSLAGPEPPAGFSPALTALWWAGKDKWSQAHDVAMAGQGADCAWVHAHLHRVEGDLENARYWYRNAGKKPPKGELKAEWAAIVSELLADTAQS